ncbi:MAG: FAD-dependent monooxygenase [Bacteroidota bacterium]|nr:FAD-dependent monooxygenase [Bacteroidota bacterium]
MNETQFDIAIVGGGPAGSTAAMFCARMGFRTCVIEKKSFPRETLCGEFLSREVVQILDELGITQQFLNLQPHPLKSFRYSSEHWQSFASELSFTGYGLRRGTFDKFLLESARTAGAVLFQPATVELIQRNTSGFSLVLTDEIGKKNITATNVIGAYGKQNVLDKSLQRNFVSEKSHLNGIKFHVPKKYLKQFPEDEIQMFTAHKLYCGVNIVNDDTATVCFLERRSEKDVPPRVRLNELLSSNSYFADIVTPDFESMIDTFPIYGTGNIFFGNRNLVESGIFMIGDAARIIAPLAGDGIGMAMQSAHIIASVLEEGRKKNLDAQALGDLYTINWTSSFRRRLRIAQQVQQVLLSDIGKKISISVLAAFPFLLPRTIEFTRG